MTHVQETFCWDFCFIFTYKGRIVPYALQGCARGGLPWQKISRQSLPAPSVSAPVSTHLPIWPSCSKGAMPRGSACSLQKSPIREFLSGQFLAGFWHSSSPPVLRCLYPLCDSGLIDFLLWIISWPHSKYIIWNYYCVKSNFLAGSELNNTGFS